MKQLSTQEAADLCGCSVRTVQRLAKRLGAGVVVGGRTLVLTQQDVERIRAAYQGRAGNPAFGDPDLSSKAGKASGAKRKRKE